MERGLIPSIYFSEKYYFFDVGAVAGVIYALHSDERTVDLLRSAPTCTEPDCPVEVSDSVELKADVRAIAVASAGHIYGAAWDGTIYHFTAAGEVVAQLDSGKVNLVDIDLSEGGHLAIGSRGGRILLTDLSLAAPTAFQVGTTPVFVAFRGAAAQVD